MDEDWKMKISAAQKRRYVQMKTGNFKKEDVCRWLWENYYKLGNGAQFKQVYEEWKVANDKV